MDQPRCDRCLRLLPVNFKAGGKDPPGRCWADHKLGDTHEAIECRDLTIERLERSIEIAKLLPTERDQFAFLESDAKFFEDIIACIEADSFACQTLWLLYHHKPAYGVRIDTWEQKGGYLIQLGNLDKRPVNIDISFNILNGSKVMFWSPISQVVDHAMIDAWFAKFKRPGTDSADAMNFTNALRKIEPFFTRLNIPE